MIFFDKQFFWGLGIIFFAILTRLTIPGIVLPSLILFYLGLIVLFLRFVILEEGTGVIVLKLGAYSKTLIAKMDYEVDKSGDIVKIADGSAKKDWYGGFRFVGFWPFYQVFVKDKFHWERITPDRKIELRDDFQVDRFLIRLVVYGIEVENAEDKDGVPTNSLWAVTAWTSNLKKAWVDTQDWFSAFKNRLVTYIRHHVSQNTYQEIISSKQGGVTLDQDVLSTLQRTGIINALKDLHGVEVIKIENINFSPDESYRKATLRKWEAERLADERVNSAAGAIMLMIAKQIGSSLAQIQSEFRDNPVEAFNKYKSLIEINKDLVEQQIASDASAESAIRRYYFRGGEGGLNLVALLGDLLKGKKA